MLHYGWPGNVRELVNVIEHAVVLCRTSRITLADLPSTLGGRSPAAHVASPASSERPGRAFRDEWLALPLREARRRVGLEFERDYLEALLTETRGAVGQTAELAGITPRSLYDKMRGHGLRKEDFR